MHRQITALSFHKNCSVFYDGFHQPGIWIYSIGNHLIDTLTHTLTLTRTIQPIGLVIK